MNSMPGMTLFASTSTPLYSTGWKPSTIGRYTGTCIFIIVLATLLRGFFAYRSIQERKLRDWEQNKRPILAPEKKQDDEARLDEEYIGASYGEAIKHRPWRISTDVPRASLNTVIAGVAYLLMLAVMTMNVGYFLSVLGGVFLGSLTFARYEVHFPATPW